MTTTPSIKAVNKRRVSGRGCKAKGDRFERDIAAYLNENVFNGEEQCRRAMLSGGGQTINGAGDADLTGTTDLWVEAKRTETINFRKAMDQAEFGINRRASNDMPIVINRKNREALEDSMVAMRLKDFIKFYSAHLKLSGVVK